MKRIMICALAASMLVALSWALAGAQIAESPAPSGAASSDAAATSPFDPSTADIPFDADFGAASNYGYAGEESKLFFKANKWNTVASDPETAKLMEADAKLNRLIHELAMKYKATMDANDRAAIANQLKETVAKQFDARQSLRERQLVALEKQVKRLRTIHAERNAQRDRIVTDRAQQLIRDAEGLGWGDVSDASGGGWGGGESTLDHGSLFGSKPKPRIKTFTESELDLSGAEEPAVSEEGATVR